MWYVAQTFAGNEAKAAQDVLSAMSISEYADILEKIAIPRNFIGLGNKRYELLFKNYVFFYLNFPQADKKEIKKQLRNQKLTAVEFEQELANIYAQKKTEINQIKSSVFELINNSKYCNLIGQDERVKDPKRQARKTKPVPCKDKEILKILSVCEIFYTPDMAGSPFREGDTVKVTYGMYRGAKGKVTEILDSENLKIKIASHEVFVKSKEVILYEPTT